MRAHLLLGVGVPEGAVPGSYPNASCMQCTITGYCRFDGIEIPYAMSGCTSHCIQSSACGGGRVRIAVLGAGAIGAYCGAALHRGGADVHLVARGDHLRAMREHGVRVISPRGDFTARPHATDDPAEIGPVDYVFLGLKAHSYPSCGALIEPLLAGHTALVPAQNGIPWWYFHELPGPY